jgi:hypothetical protein
MTFFLFIFEVTNLKNHLKHDKSVGVKDVREE